MEIIKKIDVTLTDEFMSTIACLAGTIIEDDQEMRMMAVHLLIESIIKYNIDSESAGILLEAASAACCGGETEEKRKNAASNVIVKTLTPKIKNLINNGTREEGEAFANKLKEKISIVNASPDVDKTFEDIMNSYSVSIIEDD